MFAFYKCLSTILSIYRIQWSN